MGALISKIRFPKADVPQSVFRLNLSWNFKNEATLPKVWPVIYRTVHYILCLQAGVGLYLGVGFYPTLRLGSDVGFLSRQTVPAVSNKIQTGVCICIILSMLILL